MACTPGGRGQGSWGASCASRMCKVIEESTILVFSELVNYKASENGGNVSDKELKLIFV